MEDTYIYEEVATPQNSFVFICKHLFIHVYSCYYSLKLNSNLIGQFNELLVGLLRCDNNPKAWQLTSLLYSAILLVVSSLRKSEGERNRQTDKLID